MLQHRVAQWNITHTYIIHLFFITNYPYRGHRGLDPIPPDIGWEAWNTLDKSSVLHKVDTWRRTTIDATGNLESPSNQCGRKPEYTEITHTDTGRLCKLSWGMTRITYSIYTNIYMFYIYSYIIVNAYMYTPRKHVLYFCRICRIFRI